MNLHNGNELPRQPFVYSIQVHARCVTVRWPCFLGRPWFMAPRFADHNPVHFPQFALNWKWLSEQTMSWRNPCTHSCGKGLNSNCKTQDWKYQLTSRAHRKGCYCIRHCLNPITIQNYYLQSGDGEQRELTLGGWLLSLKWYIFRTLRCLISLKNQRCYQPYTPWKELFRNW